MGTILVVLLFLWLLGFVRIPGLVIHDRVLFQIGGHNITLLGFLMFLVIAYAMESFPYPFRQIAYIWVILYLLSIFGVVQVYGLSNILIAAIIIGLVLTIF